MCGIAGTAFFKDKAINQRFVIEKMISSLRHRGPDENGFYVNDRVGLGQSRLSIIDLSGGKQPIFNEDNTIAVIFNGEIFNYPELTSHLKKKGHCFRTKSDTEVIVHAYEEYGLEFLDHLNGQFAIALWDNNKKRLILTRDRVGIRPLFYSVLPDNTIVFASEMKAIFHYPGIKSEIDFAGINQIFTLWVNIPPQTVFKNISELAPGHMLVASPEKIEIRRYWQLRYPGMNDYEDRPISYYQNRIKEILFDAVTIRLRADVPVAAYLSGGIDSSIISTIVKKYHNNALKTFSVAFSDKAYDERPFQEEMVRYLGTDHKIIEASYEQIGSSFSDVVWFAEKPMIRTAPAPLFLLSKLVRENNIKVVLTGEGADEVFGGYNIFKEDKVRRFWAENPSSKCRPMLLARLYPYVTKEGLGAKKFWQSFFKRNLTDVDNPYYSHLIRWYNTSQIKKYLKPDIQAAFDDERQIFQPLAKYTDPELMSWHPFCRAQYLEMQLFMSGYLLSSQGDRMMMGNSVEGRFPFLDYRLIEFANSIPPDLKMKVLDEKFILKQTFGSLLPASITKRDKQPYRAPIYQSFIDSNQEIQQAFLQPENIKKFSYFDSESVERLINKAKKAKGKPLAAREDMAMVGILSLQLLHHHFLENPARWS